MEAMSNQSVSITKGDLLLVKLSKFEMTGQRLAGIKGKDAILCAYSEYLRTGGSHRFFIGQNTSEWIVFPYLIPSYDGSIYALLSDESI